MRLVTFLEGIERNTIPMSSPYIILSLSLSLKDIYIYINIYIYVYIYMAQASRLKGPGGSSSSTWALHDSLTQVLEEKQGGLGGTTT